RADRGRGPSRAGTERARDPVHGALPPRLRAPPVPLPPRRPRPRLDGRGTAPRRVLHAPPARHVQVPRAGSELGRRPERGGRVSGGGRGAPVLAAAVVRRAGARRRRPRRVALPPRPVGTRGA